MKNIKFNEKCYWQYKNPLLYYVYKIKGEKVVIMTIKKIECNEKLPNYKELEKFLVRRYNKNLPRLIIVW